MNKILIGIFVCTLLLSSVASSISVTELEEYSFKPTNQAKIYYVGGSGPNNYTKIQDAVNDSQSGDTIFIYNDSSPYYENVYVNEKAIYIRGEDTNTTIIDAGGGTLKYNYAMCVSDSSGFFINGLTLQNCTSTTGTNFAFFSQHSDYMCIINCRFRDSLNGMCLQYSKNTFMRNNRFENNTYNFGLSGWWKASDFINDIDTSNTIDGKPIYNLVKKSDIILDGIDIGWLGLINCTNITVKNATISDNIIQNILLIKTTNSTICNCKLNKARQWGIKIGFSGSDDNLFYNNMFFNSSSNIEDDGNNSWNNTYPIGGNYWHDYSGDDKFRGPKQRIPGSDGIGDIPKAFIGGIDFYPLIYKWGENPPIADFSYTNNITTVYFDAFSSYDRDGKIRSFDWDFGDGTTGDGEITFHKYGLCGIYNVTLTVTDDDGLKDSFTKSIKLIFSNIPPSKPEIYGPSSGKRRVEHEYTFIGTDPDGDEIYLWVDWGDEKNSSWIGPYLSSEPIKLNHSWNKTGTYVIKAKLKDFCNESAWSTLKVSIPRNKYFLFNLPLISWLFNRYPNAFLMLRHLLRLLDYKGRQ